MNTTRDYIIHSLKKTVLLRHSLMRNMVPEGKITYNSRIVINRILLQDIGKMSNFILPLPIISEELYVLLPFVSISMHY